MRLLKAYSQLTKTGIIVFAVLSALAGFALSMRMFEPFEGWRILLLVVGIYALAAGSFALNQAQEWRQDALMGRTKNRPIPMGVFSPWQGYAIGALLVVFGSLALLPLGPTPVLLGLLTVFLYNVVYTLLWKRQWTFGAVPGAIPGAMPVVIGFSANNPNILAPECVYLFAVMFLWQMPHFWALAVRYREDYENGGFPVLPVKMGVPRTLYHIGLYVFAYVGVALMAPWFLQSHALYLLLVMPISLKVLWEFMKYFRRSEGKAWLPFFLWTNMSLLVYLAVPVMDRWLSWWIAGYV